MSNTTMDGRFPSFAHIYFGSGFSGQKEARNQKPEAWIPTSDLPVAGHRPPTSKPILYFLLALCVLLYPPTRWLHEANPIWRLTSWALALEVVGITLCVARLFQPVRTRSTASHFTSENQGRGGARPYQAIPNEGTREMSVPHCGFPLSTFRLCSVLFPVCFFLVAIPWPSSLERLVTDSLTRANVSTTTELLTVAGIPAFQTGNVIEIATGAVGVDDACSGIRSFQATLMISLFLGELYRLAISLRVILCLAGLGLAFVFNIGRTLLLVYVASRDGIAAIAKWHDPAGIVILVGCFLGLWGVAIGMRSWNVKRRGFIPLGQIPKAIEPTTNFNFPPRNFSKLAAGLIAWFLLTELAVEWWYRSHEIRATPSQSWTVRFPEGEPTYRKVQLSDSVLKGLSFDEGGQCAWDSNDGNHWQMIYFRWLPARSLYARVRAQLNKTHRPEHCLTGAGMKQVSDLGVKVFTVGNLNFALRRYVFESNGNFLRIYYAQYEDSASPDFLASYRENTGQRIAAALAGSRNYGLRSLEIAVSGALDEESADRAVGRELKGVIKVL